MVSDITNAALRRTTLVQRTAAVLAVLFGFATIVAGNRVLMGADPGYVVYRPLLIYNTAMGLGYIAAGVEIWRNLRTGKHAAAAIFLVNLFVLGIVVFLYRSGYEVAIESVRAMMFRTAGWLVLLMPLIWMSRRSA